MRGPADQCSNGVALNTYPDPGAIIPERESDRIALGPPAGPDTSVSVALRLCGAACAANGDASAIAAAATQDDTVNEIRVSEFREMGRCLWDDFIRILVRLARADILFARRKCENSRTAKIHQESFLLLMKNIFAGMLESRTQNNHETISAADRPGVDQISRLGRMPMIDVLRIRESSAPKCGAVHGADVAHGNFALRAANAELL